MVLTNKNRLFLILILSGISTFVQSQPDLKPNVWTNITPVNAQVDPANGLNIFTQGVTVDPNNPYTVYFCTAGYALDGTGTPRKCAIYKTKDGGSTWTRYNQLDAPLHIRINPANSDHLYAVDGVRGNSGGFWLSKDGGATWSQPDGFISLCKKLNSLGYNNFEDGYFIDIDPTNFEHILYTTHGCSPVVSESFDGGKSWRFSVTPATKCSGGYAVFFLYYPPAKIGNSHTWLFCTQADGMYRTTNSGASWTKISVENNMCHGGNQIYYTKSGVLFAGSTGWPAGPLRSTDNSISWQGANNLEIFTGTMGIIGDGTNLFTRPWGMAGPMLFSPENDGLNWYKFNEGTQSFSDGTFEMAYDKIHGILYASNVHAGLWACKPSIDINYAQKINDKSSNSGINAKETTSSLPGHMEAENCSAMHGILVESCSEGGMDIGYIDTGDWMDFNVNVLYSGNYTLFFRIASPNNSGVFQILSADSVLATVNIQQTGGWQIWSTISTKVNLKSGKQVIRLKTINGGYNFDWWKGNFQQQNANIPYSVFMKENIYLIDYLDNKKFPFKSNNGNSINVKKVDNELYYISLSIYLEDDSTSFKTLEIPLEFIPDGLGSSDEIKKSFHWVPNMKQNTSQIISQHVFRSPSIILTHKKTALSVIPDLDLLEKNQFAPYFMDLRFENNKTIVSYGLSNYSVIPHQYYIKNTIPFRLNQKIELGLYVICSGNSGPLNIMAKTNQFLWEKFAGKYQSSLLPQVLQFSEYADIGYNMAFEKYWVDVPNSKLGGITLSTFPDEKTGQNRGRDYKNDLWFHSWFNNLRTAYGMYSWGKQTDKKEWCNKAMSTVNLLMSAPMKDGFFPIIWVPEKNSWVSSGQGGGEGLYHLPDNIWTAYWLMRFNDELKHIQGCDTFLLQFTNGLLRTQNLNGSFPARIKVKDLTTDSILSSTASGGMTTWFLEEMLLRNKISKNNEHVVKDVISKSLNFLEEEVLPNMRFEDFEVYFSCSPKPVNFFDSITWSYPQNTLSIQWCAEAFLKAYLLFKDPKYLSEGEYCLNILSLYQQVWNPPYINLYGFGGFGTQNSDAEWSDARQAQFAETYLNFYEATLKPEYLERAIAACRASFALMVIPENKEICPLNYLGKHNEGEFPGEMAENYGHGGNNDRSGQSGFHWGTGSALTTASIFRSRLGDIRIDSKSKSAWGIDGIVVTKIDWNDTIKIKTNRIKANKLRDIKKIRITANPSEKIEKHIIIN